MNINTLLLLALQALASAATTVEICQDVTTQYIENPLFEHGVTEWTVQYGTNGNEYDVYYTSQTPDGHAGYVLALNGDHLTSNIISQEVSGLANGITYTFSMWWQLFPLGTGACTSYISFDNINLGSQSLTSTSDSGVWKQFTATYSSNDEDGELKIMVDCTAGRFADDSEVNFYNITLTGPTEIVDERVCEHFGNFLSFIVSGNTRLVIAVVSLASSAVTSVTTPASSRPTSSSSGIRLLSSSSMNIASSSRFISSSRVASSQSIGTSSSAIVSLASSAVSSRPTTSSSMARPRSSSSIYIVSSSRFASSSPASSSSSIRSSSSSAIASHPASGTSIQTSSTMPSGSHSGTSSSFTHSSLPVTTSTSTRTEHASTLLSASHGPTTAGEFTTSTIVTTVVRTITSCAASVTDCPARERSTFLTTETSVVGTTGCPVTAAESSTIVHKTAVPSITSTGEISSQQMTTSTVFTTQLHTVTACPASVTDCPASQKTIYVKTETVEAYTTVCPVTATEMSGSSLRKSVVPGTSSYPDTLSTVQVFTVTASGVAHAPTTYLATDTIPLGAASSSTASSDIVPAVASSTTASSYNIMTLQSSSPVSTDIGSTVTTEATSAVYTGASFSLKVDIMSVVLGFVVKTKEYNTTVYACLEPVGLG
ncbi:hypothetical protein UA08_06669 [Talaromyces atroroseus]|uniref:CBM-cenC domain-containing protein n=1 Tax=Talaromyces atroroseus TaxID=1441469 RepID=A0A225AAI9_TALAT|nr:hypothetical protein UA08_06669 [Talaromyces atroroseus]OKL57872.1 hypothetical protein UA08_06669 [Talaromyces atroroseus]